MLRELGQYQGIDRDRRVCLFSMRNGKDFVQCAASWALMDDLDAPEHRAVGTRDKQFERLRALLSAIATRKFISYPDDDRPLEILLRSNDARAFRD